MMSDQGAPSYVPPCPGEDFANDPLLELLRHRSKKNEGVGECKIFFE